VVGEEWFCWDFVDAGKKKQKKKHKSVCKVTGLLTFENMWWGRGIAGRRRRSYKKKN
jgi:hypothetical protein